MAMEEIFCRAKEKGASCDAPLFPAHPEVDQLYIRFGNHNESCGT
jgi:hypothetical protein